MKASDNLFPKLLLTEGAAPATPAADSVAIYRTATGLWMKDEAGNQYQLAFVSDDFAVAAGTGDAMTATLSPAITSLTDGMHVFIRAVGANTVTNPTLNLNGLGALEIFKHEVVALEVGDIAGAGHELLLVYRAAGTCWMLLNPMATAGGGGGGGSGGGMELVATTTPLGAAATTMTVAGLDLDTDGEYELRFFGKHAGAIGYIAMTYNADTTATNYDTIVSRQIAANVAGAEFNNGNVFYGADTMEIRGRLTRDLNGRPRTTFQGSVGAPGTGDMGTWTSSHRWRTAGTNVIGITFTHTTANGFAAGSYFEVWKHGTSGGGGGGGSASAGAISKWNWLDKGSNVTITNKLRNAAVVGTWQGVRGTKFLEGNGFWYWEVVITATSGADNMVGIAPAQLNLQGADFVGKSANSYAYYGSSGVKYNNNAGTAYGASYTTGDVIGVAAKCVAGVWSFWFSKNNVWQNSGDPAAGTNPAFSAVADECWFPACSANNATTFTLRSETSEFTGTIPTGATALGE